MWAGGILTLTGEQKMTASPKKKAPKKAKTATAPAPVVVVTEAEKKLQEKYSHQSILPGSYLGSGGREGWGAKHTVIVVCPLCDGHRVLCTSDLQWQTTRFCRPHAADAKKNAQKTKAAKKEKK